MKKNFKTITIRVELSSTEDLEKITSDMIKNVSKCAVKTLKSKSKKISLDSIEVHQFPLNVD